MMIRTGPPVDEVHFGMPPADTTKLLSSLPEQDASRYRISGIEPAPAAGSPNDVCQAFQTAAVPLGVDPPEIGPCDFEAVKEFLIGRPDD